MSRISSIISKVKGSFEVSYEELKSKPHLIEPDESSMKYIEKEIIELCSYSSDSARKNAEKYLKLKFFPADLRAKLWLSLVENKSQLNPKLFKLYSDTLEKKLSENENYGSMPMIESGITQVLEVWGLTEESSALVKSVARILLVFEYYQPNIGYVPGMEKIVLFLRKLTDDSTSFILFYNVLFNSKLMWSYLEGKKTLTEFNLEILEKMCGTAPGLKKTYEVNRQKFERFFLQHAPFVYLDVFEPAIIERIMDHLVVMGEGVLYILMVEVVVDSCMDIDMSDMSYLQCEASIIEMCSKIDSMRIYHKMLISMDLYDVFLAKKKEVIK